MLKEHSTIGCCGIDCGLCTRYYTQGNSRCPGCGGEQFDEKHPSCGFITCCVREKGLEACGQCPEYPCQRFDKEKNGYDSFVTHRMVFLNQEVIQKQGLTFFLNQQKIRMDILVDFLERYDDGRSKGFFCLSCTLLPLSHLLEVKNRVDRIPGSLVDKNLLLKKNLQAVADKLGILLRLNHPSQKQP